MYYSKILKYLPPFIKGAGKVLDGTVNITVSGTSISIVGTRTHFLRDIKINDEILVYNSTTANYGKSIRINDILTDTSMSGIGTGLVSDTNLEYIVIDNLLLQAILVTFDIMLTRLYDELYSNFRFSLTAKYQLAKENRIYLGKWEDLTQVTDFFSQVFSIHEYRGSLGRNMVDLNDYQAFGILGELDRVTKNPTGTTAIETYGDWVLAGDAAISIDGSGHVTYVSTATTREYRYPDYTIPSVAHPFGEYSPYIDAVCFLDVLDLLYIEIENLNSGNYSNEVIREEVCKYIIPADIPYMVHFS